MTTRKKKNRIASGDSQQARTQLRGGLLNGQSGASVTYSPFVGEFNALNIVGDSAQIEAAIAGMEGAK